MKVVWKRPDGFHGASPEDYEVVEVAGNARIWLHKRDRDNFPFRISGGWQDEAATSRLNHLVNLLNKPKEDWVYHLLAGFHDSKEGSSHLYLAKTRAWLGDVLAHLKGDHWEVTIMAEVLGEVTQRLVDYEADL